MGVVTKSSTPGNVAQTEKCYEVLWSQSPVGLSAGGQETQIARRSVLGSALETCACARRRGARGAVQEALLTARPPELQSKDVAFQLS